MAFKAAGAPIDLWREHVTVNASGNFAATILNDSRSQMHGLANPTRNIVRDATAYGTEPLEDDWIIRLRQGWTPANTKGDGTIGSLT